jgi:Tol biopolymer transport system component
VVFVSDATNLVAGASGSQIYRKDLENGTITLVSSTDGTSANRGNNASDSPQITADGRFVVFQSSATNLVAGANGSQIYRKDLQTNTITLVSSTDGTAANRGNNSSESPQITPDGKFVVFRSSATNLFSGANGGQIYRKDLENGTITLVSSTDGTAVNRGNNHSYSPQITANGRFVVFRSNSTNLFSGASGWQIYRKDLVDGTITLVSSTDGTAANRGNNSSSSPQITADGRYVVFASSSTNLVAGANGSQIYRKDLQTNTITLVSSTDGTAANQGNSPSESSKITADGRYVVFQSSATNLVSGASGSQIYRKDLQTNTITLVSSTDGTAANQGNNSSSSPQITADGRYVVFQSSATNLVAGASGSQIYRKDLENGTITLVSSTDGTAANQGNNSSTSPQITVDGRYVVFASSSTNLVAGANGSQIYRKDLQANTITLVSSTDGTATNRGNNSSESPQITADGRFVVFASSATNLVAGASGSQIYRKDLVDGTIMLLSSTDGTAANRGNNTSSSPQITPDGRYLVFRSSATNLVAGTSEWQIYLKVLP